jgi:hypothetical protein
MPVSGTLDQHLGTIDIVFQAVADFARLDVKATRLKDVLDKNALMSNVELDDGRTFSRAQKLDYKGNVIAAFG